MSEGKVPPQEASRLVAKEALRGLESDRGKRTVELQLPRKREPCYTSGAALSTGPGAKRVFSPTAEDARMVHELLDSGSRRDVLGRPAVMENGVLPGMLGPLPIGLTGAGR